MPETGFTATDLDLISFLKAIPDARMRRAGFVFLPGPCCCWRCSRSSAVAKACEIWSVSLDATMWCLARSWGFELQRPPSDSVQGLRHAGLRPGRRYVFLQVDVVALCTAIRAWTIAQIPGGAADLDQLVCDGKTLRGSLETTSGDRSALIAQAVQ